MSLLLRGSGRYTDAETGLIYLRARYYDPSTGQMLYWDEFKPDLRPIHTAVNADAALGRLRRAVGEMVSATRP
jgi:RHS repeat-associated protein